MGWPKPVNSKNRVRAAGKAIVKSRALPDSFLNAIGTTPLAEFVVAENWRAAHGAVLNTAQAWLRRMDAPNKPIIGQRLKRFETIVDKLRTGRSKDLSTMNDIAGVRAIFRSEADLREYREKQRLSRAKHKLTHDRNKFDYILRPKPTGYRGIHDIYERQVPSISGMPWNGLKFEVQLRTAVQHAWATAVEIFDSTRQSRFKFEASSDPAYEQFLIASELFARIHEQSTACLPESDELDLVTRFMELDKKTELYMTIASLQILEAHGALTKNSILQRKKDGSLAIHRYKSMTEAIKSISDIEKSSETLNAVLVGATTPHHIRDAFRNYFDDTSDFIKLLNSCFDQVNENAKAVNRKMQAVIEHNKYTSR